MLLLIISQLTSTFLSPKEEKERKERKEGCWNLSLARRKGKKGRRWWRQQQQYEGFTRGIFNQNQTIQFI
jgi:hypothetical protein